MEASKNLVSIEGMALPPRFIRTGISLIILLSGLSMPPGAAAVAPGHTWALTNPSPQANTLEDFYILGSQLIFAVGEGGAMVRSEDGGATWINMPIGLDAWLRGVHFTDAMTGTIVGEKDLSGTLLHTTDGGETWQDRTPAGAPWLESVDFSDAENGVVVGWSGAVFWTTDGGLNWTSRATSTTERLRSVHVFNATHAIAVGGEGSIVRTADAGASWTSIPCPTSARMESIDFGDSLHGVAVGNDGTVISSNDGGLTWVLRNSGTTNWLRDVEFGHGAAVVAVGGQGAPLVSTDGGIHWSPLVLPVSEYWTAADFTDDGALIITGNMGSLWQSDPTWAGWENGQIGTTVQLREIANATDEIAVAVGSEGVIMRTGDAGLTWTEISTDSSAHLAGVDFSDADTGMIVGSGGLVLRTDDAGLTWRPLNSGVAHALWAVACIDEDHAVAVGEGRSVLHTANGGETWQERDGGSTSDFGQAVFFGDSLNGWYCTFFGDIYHTTDGGLSWTLQVHSFLDLQAIHFSDFLHGICVGGVDGNATLLTDDGGVTWTQQPNPENAYLSGVAFSDPLTGIAVGQGIFRTIDGAATWQRDDAPFLYFQDVCLMAGGVALVVGASGSIVRAGPAEVVGVHEDLPSSMNALRVYPNPFNPRTTVSFAVDRPQAVELSIFDLSGKRIAVLASGWFEAGRHSLPWEGCDERGHAVAAGTYLLRMVSAGGVVTDKMMLIK